MGGRAGVARHAAAERLAAVVEQALDALVLTDTDGVIVEWNAAATALLGLSAADARGRRLTEIAGALGATAAECATIDRALQGEVARFEPRRRAADGRLRHLAFVASPVRDAAGAVAGAFLMGRDVTELRAAERERDLAAARHRFLATASGLLAESLDLERTLEAVASLLVPEWADACVLSLLDDDGRLTAKSVDCADPARRDLVAEAFGEHTVSPRPGGLIERALTEAQAVFAADYADPERAGAGDPPRGLRTLGVRSLVVAPLRTRGAVIGVLFAAMAEPSRRRFSPADVHLVQDLADRAAQAIDNARLFEEARAAEERFRAAFHHAPIGVALLARGDDRRPRYAEVNPALCRITGRAREALLGHVVEVLAEAHHDVEPGERRFVRADGEERWVHVRTAPLGAAGPSHPHQVALIEDVTDRRRFARELEHLASHDTLTGLLNRRRFEEELERALAHARRHGDPAAVVTLDLDNFKHVNDTYGHATGDELLRETARTLLDRVRETDSVGRLGGDEFGIVLWRSGPAEAAEVVRGLLDAFRTRVGVTVDERTVRVTASAGVRSLDPDAAMSAGELLGEADIAMYDAKERGRDRLSVVGVTDVQPARVRSRMRWAERIRDALEHDGFVLYEQPIVRLADGRVDRAELLIRMLDDGRRPIDPISFLPVAERYGHIRAIDRWVVRRAVALVRDRQAAGTPIGAEVNLSGDSISDASVVDHIVSEIRDAGIDPAWLTFEVTETAAIGNLDRARRLAQQLTELGCGVALDDFGAGFGSFAYLKHLPVDIIKIDGEFIRSLLSSPADEVTVRAIVGLARGLGKQTVAEYVEDAATLELLRRLGVDRAQGHHIGRPRPAAVRPEFS